MDGKEAKMDAARPVITDDPRMGGPDESRASGFFPRGREHHRPGPRALFPRGHQSREHHRPQALFRPIQPMAAGMHLVE
jgi:hypothetical protein